MGGREISSTAPDQPARKACRVCGSQDSARLYSAQAQGGGYDNIYRCSACGAEWTEKIEARPLDTSHAPHNAAGRFSCIVWSVVLIVLLAVITAAIVRQAG